MRLWVANFRQKILLDGAAREEDNPLQFLVVEEIVEAPQAPGLSEGIRIQVGIVAVNIAVVQLDFIVDCCPQMVLELSVWGRIWDLISENFIRTADVTLLSSYSWHVRIDRVHDKLNRRLLAEFMALKKFRILRRNQGYPEFINKETGFRCIKRCFPFLLSYVSDDVMV